MCYSIFDRNKYIGADTSIDLNRYYEVRKQAILRHYQESSDFLILDEHIKINNAQFDEFIKVVNEIKS